MQIKTFSCIAQIAIFLCRFLKETLCLMYVYSTQLTTVGSVIVYTIINWPHAVKLTLGGDEMEMELLQ